MDAQLQQKLYMIKYGGYKGINLEKFNLNQLKNLKQICQLASKKAEYATVTSDVEKLSEMSLDEIHVKAKKFCNKYFNLHNINFGTMQSIQNSISAIPLNATIPEITEIINSSIESINPFDLNINLVDAHAMTGQILKPIPFAYGLESNPDRKMYFSNIEIGKQLNGLSIGTIVHEIAHAEQEHNLGYAEDYFNKEIISIFLEKLTALEMDSTGNLLKLSERVRLLDIIDKYSTLLLNPNSISEVEKTENLMYIKSLLNAEKLFDMYINERKPKNRDKYFAGIQDVFDGKITVEDMLNSRNITSVNSQNFEMLKRHL